MEKYDPGAKTELDRLAAAEEAARRGNSAKVVASLKGVGRWVGDFAAKVGVQVVATIIEKLVRV